MANRNATRSAFTLVEFLVVVAITAVLIALLLPAVQNVRSAALHLQSANNVKELGLALHGYADAKGYFPAISGSPVSNVYEFSFFVGLLPYVEQGTIYQVFFSKFGSNQADSGFVVPVYCSPLDPTSFDNGGSYAVNAAVFSRRGLTFKNVRDGTSTTVAFGEHYSYDCGGTVFSWVDGLPFSGSVPGGLAFRRATFADRVMGDAYPISQAQTAQSSIPGVTFQNAPPIADCNPRLAQGLSQQGMLVGLLDGSVRTLDPGISEPTYWSSLTPAGGEVLGPDW